jgi:quercetin 2,3-dioxygenase
LSSWRSSSVLNPNHKLENLVHVTRRSNDRGFADFGWLKSRHTFSFGGYHDPQHMGFGPLRVINEDRVAAGAGFGKHPHRDMEILSWVLSGALEHKDSLGNGAKIQPGELQRMTAGTGVTHSEFNASSSEPVHFLQIWIIPDSSNLEPGYEQRHFAPDELSNRWRCVASGKTAQDAVGIHQDVDLYVTRLDAGIELSYETTAERKLWLQVSRGRVIVDGDTLEAGDGAAWANGERITARAEADCELLLFDMTT